MVARIPFAEIVQENRQVKQVFSIERSVRFAQFVVPLMEFGRALHGQDAMFIDSVLMVLIELHKASSVSHGRHEDLEHSQLVKSAQESGEPCRLREERQEPPSDVG